MQNFIPISIIFMVIIPIDFMVIPESPYFMVKIPTVIRRHPSLLGGGLCYVSGDLRWKPWILALGALESRWRKRGTEGGYGGMEEMGAATWFFSREKNGKVPWV